ncbi:hypothetical protein V5799_033187 [Amblyomma americanum]|uniref:Uncharacterized protein n=1 Tax=Amblyomma americanum TaxID=6943 RepID=A0AAQ4DP15_AMBAM
MEHGANARDIHSVVPTMSSRDQRALFTLRDERITHVQERELEHAPSSGQACSAARNPSAKPPKLPPKKNQRIIAKSRRLTLHNSEKGDERRSGEVAHY